MTIQYLALSDLAKVAGITFSTAKSYKAKGLLPEPDAMVGTGPRAVRAWLPETVEQWVKNRPGQGFRSDLQGK